MLDPGFSREPCGARLAFPHPPAPLAERPQTDLARLNRLNPRAAWDLATGTITVELEAFGPVVRWLADQDFTPDDLLIEIDGERLVPVDGGTLESLLVSDAPTQPSSLIVRVDGGRHWRQTDLRLVFLRKGREVYVSEPWLFEDLAFPRISPESLASLRVPELALPAWLSARIGEGSGPSLLRMAAEAQRAILQVIVHPGSTNAPLITAFRQRGASLRIEARLDSATGEITGWKITDTVKGAELPAALEDLCYFANAAFNSNVFRWDGDAANAALRFSNPLLAKGWFRYLLESQKRQGNGLLTRENRSSNLRPFHREHNVKLGRKGPVISPNGEIFNPPLTGLAIRDLYRSDPGSYSPETLREIAQSLGWEREWLARTRGVPGKGHSLLGFTWTNLGSGRDNSPRPLEEPGCLAVDLISYYTAMLDQEADLQAILGEWRAARALETRADELRALIDREYWNEPLGFYTDIIKTGDDRIERSPIRTMVGFWPLLARVPGKGRLHRLLEENLREPRRFGDGPYPPSVAADHAGERDARGPLFDWMGRYWRGGGWPIDWTLLKKGLRLNGLRAEAARQQDRILAGLAEASRAYQQGDSPSQLNIAREPVPSPVSTMREPVPSPVSTPTRSSVARSQGVFWESVGRVPRLDAASKQAQPNRLRVTFNRQPSGEGGWHQTRENLGWSLATPLETLEDRLGLEGVPRFQGGEPGVWLHQLLSGRLFSSHQVRFNPALGSALAYLRENPHATAGDFAAWLAGEMSRSPELTQQVRWICGGYLELSPTFDPGTGQGEDATHVENLWFQGGRLELRIARLTGERVSLRVKSDRPFRVQFNRCWKGEGAGSLPMDQPDASSRIVEVGGPGPGDIVLELEELEPAGKPGREIFAGFHVPLQGTIP